MQNSSEAADRPDGYERPALIVLGDFATLTQGETGQGNDVREIAT